MAGTSGEGRSLVTFPNGNLRSSELCCNDKNIRSCLSVGVNKDLLLRQGIFTFSFHRSSLLFVARKTFPSSVRA